MDAEARLPEQELSPELAEAFRHLRDRPLPLATPEKVRAIVQRCAADPNPPPVERRGTRRRTRLAVAALAAGLLLAAFAWWSRSAPEPGTGQETSPETGTFVRADPIRRTSAGPRLGPAGAGHGGILLELPPCHEPAWVGILQITGSAITVRTATDRACPSVPPGRPVPLNEIVFDRRADTRVLVVWCRKPCGDALARGVSGGSIRCLGRDEGEHQQLVGEVARAIGERPLQYRIDPLEPDPEPNER